MCGIGCLLCQSTIVNPNPSSSSSSGTATNENERCTAQLYEQLLQRLSVALQPRGPDATRTFSNISSSSTSPSSSSSSLCTSFGMTASVLHMQGTTLCTQPLPSSSDNSILCWNGEVFGGSIPMRKDTSDTQYVLDSIFQRTWKHIVPPPASGTMNTNSSVTGTTTTNDTTALAESYGIALAKALGEQIIGPYAFLYYHNPTDTLYFGRDPSGRRSLLIHCPDNLVWEGSLYDMTDYLGDNEEDEEEGGRKVRTTETKESLSNSFVSPFALSSMARTMYNEQPFNNDERNTLIISSVAIPISSISTTKLRYLYSEIPPFGVYQIRKTSSRPESVNTFVSSSATATSSSLYATVHPWPKSSCHYAGTSLSLPPPPPTNEGSKYQPITVAPSTTLPSSSTNDDTPSLSLSYPPFADEIVTRIALELLNRLSRAVKVRVNNVAVPAPVLYTNIPLETITYHTKEKISVPTALKKLASHNYSIYDLPNVASNVFPSSPSSSLTSLRGASIAVLFSGGLDSMILAALAHAHAPSDEPIDLVTVCFASHDRSSPDRLAAIAGLQELRSVYPQRHWQLILVDDTFEAAVERSQHILDLLSPRCTHMDFNIGNALWSGSRGIGFVETDSTSPSVLSKSNDVDIGKAALLRYGTTNDVSTDGSKHVSLSSFNGKAAVSIDTTELPFDKMMQYVNPEDIATSITSIRSYTCGTSENVMKELEYLTDICHTVRKEYRTKVEELYELARTVERILPDVKDSVRTDNRPNESHDIIILPSPESSQISPSSAIAHSKTTLIPPPNDTKHRPPRICLGPGPHNRGCLGGSASTCPRSMCKLCCTKVYLQDLMKKKHDLSVNVVTCKVHKNKDCNENSRPEVLTQFTEPSLPSVTTANTISSSTDSNTTTALTSTDPQNVATFSGKNRILIRSSARVVLVGIGADEQLGGYGRHRAAFIAVSWPGVNQELQKDMNRIWIRNLGRDDRLISDHGRESRSPYLDEGVISFIRSLPLPLITDPRMVHGIGDKRLLRAVGRLLGLRGAACLVKRAIHFGTRIAKASNVYAFGSNARANGLGSTMDWELALGITEGYKKF